MPDCRCTEGFTCHLHLKPPPPLDLSQHWAEIEPSRFWGYWVRHVSSGGLSSTIGSWWCPTRRWAEWKGRRLCRNYDRVINKSESWRVS